MNHIEKIIYINLDCRSDRRAEIENEFARMSIPADSVMRFPAVENTIHPFIGCTESHLQVLKLARRNGYKNVLIMEDDFSFTIPKEMVAKGLQRFFEMHPDYDVVMLSYNLLEGQSCDDIVGKVIRAQTASGYLVNSAFYDTIIETMEIGLMNLRKTHKHWLFMNDQYWKTIQGKSNWFYFLERMGKQRKSYSNLVRRIVDYNC